MKFSPVKPMDIDVVLAEAELAIERNKAMTSGSGRYRADHHADMVTICAMLRDEVKATRQQARSEVPQTVSANLFTQDSEPADDAGQDFTGLNNGIVRAAYRVRSAG